MKELGVRLTRKSNFCATPSVCMNERYRPSLYRGLIKFSTFLIRKRAMQADWLTGIILDMRGQMDVRTGTTKT